jgi:acyl-CoA thioesterase-1
MRLTLTLLCALTLSACGGGSSPSPIVAAQPPASAPVCRPVNVSAQGDSTMWGTQSVNGTAYQTPYNPPALMQANLQSYLGVCVTVSNDAVAGTDYGNRLFGTGNDAGLAFPQYQNWLLNNASQVVIVNFALNDANPGNVWNETPDEFRQDMEVFVTETAAAGKFIVLEEPNPTAFEPWNTILATYVAIIDQVAAEHNIPLVQQYDYIMSLPNWQSMLIDGLHPTPALYEIKASREVAVLLPIVKTLSGN